MARMLIETSRLILREIDPERDFDGWAHSMADEETVRYLGTEPMSRGEAWRNMAMAIGHWRIRGYGPFSVELRETGEWVGRVGPWYPEAWPVPEVGWTISPRHLRRGYALEAARAAIEFVFGELGWPRVHHVIHEDNEASIALAAKLGSSLFRTYAGIPGITDRTVLVYAQPRADQPVSDASETRHA
jgi:RimJ/RimL family protein N-acetyltransferase